MKSILMLIFIVGVVIFSIGYMKEKMVCPKQKYPPLIKETVEDQIVGKPVMSVFKNMFEDASPWMNANYDSTFTAGTTRNRALY